MSQKKTTTQAAPATFTGFLTSPEMIQLVRDLAIVSKAESSKFYAFTAPRVSARLKQCKSVLASAKAALKRPQQPVKPSCDNWDKLETPTLARKLGEAQFETWQHLKGVMETPDTSIHVQAYNLSVASH